MSARETILSTIRSSLHVTGDDATRRAAVDARLQSTPRGIVPQRGQGSPEQQVATFIAEATRVQATVAELANPDEVPREIARYLSANNLPATLRMGSDQRLSHLNWSATQLTISQGPSAGDDLNGLSHAEGGIAETGTLCLLSGPHNPTTLNFLPDNHIVILKRADLVGDLESLWSRLRQRFGAGTLPRTVNLITGPSRSADIEQQMLLGAHGPRRLHILIVP
jgi:L-lactate dehydrogenase complex protein LldG